MRRQLKNLMCWLGFHHLILARRVDGYTGKTLSAWCYCLRSDYCRGKVYPSEWR